MNRAAITAALYLFLTFASGVAVGGFGFWMYTSRAVQAVSSNRPVPPEEYRKKYIQMLEAELKLTPDQLQKLNAVLDSTRALFHEVGEKHRPEYEAIQQHQREQIRSLLDANQKPAFDKFLQKMDQQRGKGARRPPI